MGEVRERAKPIVVAEYCKGCSRCLESCAHHCFAPGSAIHPLTGLVPVVVHLETCTGCALCFDACPEPYSLAKLSDAPGVDAGGTSQAMPPAAAPMAKGAVKTLRRNGINAGLFRPVTLWPFPIRAFIPLLTRARRILVVEASAGQLEDELRLALSHAEVRAPVSIERINRYGGVLPSHDEIVAHVIAGSSAARARGTAA
jgi:NAD-dependent dihydropyrimidine dehydrogenase PreA subunit